MTLTLALPSKGRMKEDAVAALANAGIGVESAADSRSYRAAVTGVEGLEVVLMSASEIARELRGGAIDFGVTGEDLVREGMSRVEERVEFVARLGFGHADVVVAVPQAWVDVETIADLADVASAFRQRHHRRMRVATKYWRLTQDFLSRRHGIDGYRTVESLGATEGAPAAGSADIVVDITSTGSTLRANRLKVPKDGLILASQACLVMARRPREAAQMRVADEIRRRFAAGRPATLTKPSAW